jgi:hypothetical protein
MSQNGFIGYSAYFEKEKLFSNHQVILDLTDIMDDTSELVKTKC